MARRRVATTRGGRLVDARAVLGRLPAAAWMCALIALVNAFAWSIITPPFQGKDEVDHFAYVEQLAENGTLPKKRGTIYSPEQTLVMEGLHYYRVRFTPSTPSISSEVEQRTLLEDVGAGASLKGSGEAGVATSEPPLYYALETIPYALGSGNILVQLQLMRLFSVILGAITALLTFLFLREVLPSAPWAATVGAVCVALQPVFGFMSGSVNPDTMLFTISAGVFLCLGRAFRRGFTTCLAMALGLLVAAGFMTKLNFIGLAFGVFAGVVVLTVREARSRGRSALHPFAMAVGIGLAPVLLYALRNVLANRPIFGVVSGLARTITAKSLMNHLSYIWELFLPRLPGMTHYFQGISTFKDIWFDRSVGLYGWMDTPFPGWVDNIALALAGAVALLCGRELFLQRGAVKDRLSELCTYAAITAGVLVMLGISSYDGDVVIHEAAFGEPRYLLPMLPLLGGAMALAVRGAGRRWFPVAGAGLVVLFLGHDIFSQLQVIARYYG
jgi:4-amino-4-deoxy-L-arabinose transferase-like glycosyltransferase